MAYSVVLKVLTASLIIRSMATSQTGRVKVPSNKKAWSVPWPDYQPVRGTLVDGMMGQSYCDPEIGTSGFHPKFNEMDGQLDRRSLTGPYEITPDGYPLCPTGRTGACMRRRLGRWGPNHAADPIVTRWIMTPNNPSGHKVLSVALIRRGDDRSWALPGGMVDPGENTKDTAAREFMEEAMSILQVSPKERKEVEGKMHDLFKNGVRVWAGVVNDSRNSDNAWMESEAYHFHDEWGILENVTLKAGDDAIGVRWCNVDKSLENVLFSTHLTMIKRAAEVLHVTW